MRRAILHAAVLTALWLGHIPAAHAHEGPPFPLVVDRKAGPYVISIWTDPDVGVGTFFVILEHAPGTTLPAENKVEVCVQPTNGRLPEACYPGTLQDLRGRVQYEVKVEFDRQEMWRVRVHVSGANGAGEVFAEVEATPAGFGAWDLLIYGFPFVLFGLLWLAAALRGRRSSRASGTASTEPQAPDSDAAAGNQEKGELRQHEEMVMPTSENISSGASPEEGCTSAEGKEVFVEGKEAQRTSRGQA